MALTCLQIMRRARGWRLVSVLLLSIMLSSCGFTLRGNLPLSQYPAIYVEGQRHSALLTQIKQQLDNNQVQVLTSYQATAPMIKLSPDKLQRRALSLFPSGQVAEYELVYSVDYELMLPGQEPQPFSIELYRDYQDDPNRALAKTQELDLLLQELRSHASQRILRQLSRL